MVPGTSVLQFTLESDVEALISVDGYLNVPLRREDRIRIEASPYKARFLRTHPANQLLPYPDPPPRFRGRHPQSPP